MNSAVVIILSFLFFVLPYKICKSSSPQIVEVFFDNEEDPDPGTPLFLTPLIKSGKIEEARSKAFVRHHEMGDVESYSGYFTVNEKYKSNLFVWFFPAKIYTETAPVILWLQGGPGLTSLIGLFVEHGPFYVTSDKNLEEREFSWHLKYNIIYIDNPVGTGFSFGDKKGYVDNVTYAARDLHTALEQFFLLFPSLQNNDFFVIGEGYAGKYAIGLSHAIKNHNISAETKINLKGLALANGFCDPENQLRHSDYLYQIGLIDFHGKAEFEKYENETLQFIKENHFTKALYSYHKLFGQENLNYQLSLFYNLTGLSFDYQYLNASVNDDLYYYSYFWWFMGWIKKVDVRQAIHVGDHFFNYFNDLVYLFQSGDHLKSVVTLLQELLEHYKVLVYHGQLNIVNSYPLAANYLEKMNWSGAEKFATAPKKSWIVDGDIAGYVKSADNLKFVLVRNAGRMISADQPKLALDLIHRFISNEEF